MCDNKNDSSLVSLAGGHQVREQYDSSSFFGKDGCQTVPRNGGILNGARETSRGISR